MTLRGCLAAVVLFIVVAPPHATRAAWSGSASDDAARMPAPFAFATARDVLEAAYPSYRPATHAIAALRTTQGKPPHAFVLEARPWYVAGASYLVVAIARADDPDRRRESLCGGCWERYSLAVLGFRGRALRLVAKTHDDGSIEGSHDAIDLAFKGDGTASLDLAPYRLSRVETLLAVRNTWSTTGGAFSTSLDLFRIVGRDVRGVASIPVAGAQSEERGTFENEIATVTSASRPGSYDDLVVVTRRFRSSGPEYGNGYDFEPRPRDSEIGSPVRARYIFDGTRFRKR